MITIVIPTFNRAYTLKRVLDSYFCQKNVSEIIIIDDASKDNTEDIVKFYSQKYPKISTKYFRHGKKMGAAAGRKTGYKNATSEYILFGEDDVLLAPNYCETLLSMLIQDKTVGVISGRIIYLEYKESEQSANKRFGYGTTNKKAFNWIRFGCNVNAKFQGDIQVPVTHALFLTRKKLLKKFEYDTFYSKGTGYREETDFQIKVYLNNYKNIVTSSTKCYHLNRQEVQKGGQHTNRLSRFYWNVYYTKYFYDTYFEGIRKKQKIVYGKKTALFLFALNEYYFLFIRPVFKMKTYLLQRYLSK